MIFVGDMADVFHAERPRHVIARIVAVASCAQQHIFQFLTKRDDGSVVVAIEVAVVEEVRVRPRNRRVEIAGEAQPFFFGGNENSLKFAALGG